MKRNLLLYLALLAVFFAALFTVLEYGDSLEFQKASVNPTATGSTNSTPGTPAASLLTDDQILGEWVKALLRLLKGLRDPLPLLLMQIGLVMIVARIAGRFAVFIGQPSVIGEIIAGILLGPSLFGSLQPEAYAFVFPKSSMGNLQLLSQIGLVFFMFVVGMELDLKILRNQADSAILISHASILLPFILGAWLALSLYPNLAPPGISFLSFSLFLGIGMSITAFPVLARIVQERGLTKTKMGGIALTCAATDDVTAWCLLACVIALVQAGGFVPGIFTILLAISYILIMLFIVRPWMKRAGNIFTNREALTKTAVTFFLLFPLASAWITEAIGIHALFGAFLAGVVMPEKPKLRTLLAEKVEDVSLTIFLPLFFALTGIRTQMGLLFQGNLWLDFAAVLGVAVTGKFAGSAIAARLAGRDWKESLSLGALMNTRGLMELIVLNIGFDYGILSAEVFSMMVLMALVTTFMTGPLLDGIEKAFSIPSQKQIRNAEEILLAFALNSRGIDLLRLAFGLFPHSSKLKEVTALHLSPDSTISGKMAQRYEKSSFEPLHKLSRELGIKLKTLYKPSDNVTKDILKTLQSREYKIFLMGGARSLFSDDVLGGKIRTLLSESNGDAGILVSEKLGKLGQLTVAIFSEKDSSILPLACNIAKNYNSIVSLWDPSGIVPQLPEKDRTLLKKEKIPILRGGDPSVLGEADLILCDLDAWEEEPELRNWELSDGAGLLLLRIRKNRSLI
ncbi:sodium:proton antiporter [Leptospira perolatii]|uniref:Sodium:proton antiporter n=1 Tax=Leptospira perolatii TaxID=2023191 RepID=A0A2M9ZQ77_9LEPT|nr:cation:proton antiporter [Leptospira perolatii]PJZ68303.1 sodium:proton antiporter [Leptospira perolatii]PJZ74230.1 sodium:proton antiporter [Leptospira perolatii]